VKKILWKSGLVGSDFLMCGVILFLLGYLCIDVPKLHNNIFYGLVLFPLLFCAKKRHFIKLHGSLLVNAFFVFLFYSVCTVFWSEFYSEELLWRYFKRLLYIYGLFLAIYIIVISRPNFPSLFTISSVFILAVCAAGCVYLFFDGKNLIDARMWGPGGLSHPSFFAGVFVAYIGGFLVHCRDSKKYIILGIAANKIHLLYLLFIVALGLLVVMLTASRSAFVAVFAMIIFYILVEKKLNWVLYISCFTIVGSAFIYLTILWDVPKSLFFERKYYRYDIWMTFFDKWEQCGYLFGCGMNGWKTEIVQAHGSLFMHAHSIYVGQLHTGGLVQLFAYVWLLLFFVYKGISSRGAKPWAVILVAGAAITLFDGSKLLTTPSPLWLLLFIPMSIIAALSIDEHRKTSE
jgi:hypothetical protein|tara:strand:- start:1070 stop:2278 length:1209 start_codon:yes stop_codon:yes gene_type:complete